MTRRNVLNSTFNRYIPTALNRCKGCGIELDSYISKWGANVRYHYLTKFCHICLENRRKARYRNKQEGWVAYAIR